MEITIDNYIPIQHPCIYSTVEKPRGGCIIFIKENLMKFVENIEKKFNDCIIVYMCHNIMLCCFYIPPANSNYFAEHFDIIEAFSSNEKETPKNIIICGDLNSRIGSVGKLNDYFYQENPNVIVNQHGRKLLEICKNNNLLPLNNMNNFSGDFTHKKRKLSIPK